jgi:tetratricopeptide (TPR) repeat protein
MPEKTSHLYERLERFLDKKKVFVILGAVGLFTYANSFLNDMFWDDYDSIINNRYVKSWEFFPRYFTENLTAGAGIMSEYWRPLLLFSFSLDYKIGGLEPFFYHLQSLAWHVAAAFLLFLVAVKLLKNRTAALAVALLFLVHPVQAEAVAYVAGRADPMHTVLMLGSFLSFLVFLETKSRKRYVVSIVFFLLALLVKERAIVLPLLLVAYAAVFHGRELLLRWKRWAAYLAPFFFLAAAYLTARMTILRFTDTFDWGAQNFIGAQTVWDKLAVYVDAVATYAGLLVFPDRLTMERSVSVPRWTDPAVWAGALVLMLVLIGIAVSFKRKRIFAFGMSWFLLALLPSLHVLPIQGVLYEHWLYPALPGLCLAVGQGFHSLVSRQRSETARKALIGLLLIALAAFSMRTMARNADWQNPVRFYEKTVASGGESARVYTNLGMAYDAAKKPEQAIEAYRKAVASDDQLFQPWYDMGNAYVSLGRKEEALDAYAKAMDLNPYFPLSYVNASALYFSEKKYVEAEAVLRRADAAVPENPQVLYNLGLVLRVQNRKDEAREFFGKVLDLDPGNDRARSFLYK